MGYGDKSAPVHFKNFHHPTFAGLARHRPFSEPPLSKSMKPPFSGPIQNTQARARHARAMVIGKRADRVGSDYPASPSPWSTGERYSWLRQGPSWSDKPKSPRFTYRVVCRVLRPAPPGAYKSRYCYHSGPLSKLRSCFRSTTRPLSYLFAAHCSLHARRFRRPDANNFAWWARAK